MNPFDKILIKTPKSSRYDQKNTNKLSARAGKIFPIWWKDITPNEQIKLKISSLVKTAPMVAPIFDRIKLETFAFFVPYRLLGWNSEAFFNLSTPVADRPLMPQVIPTIGPASAWSDTLLPTFNVTDQSGELMDYLGYNLYRMYTNGILNGLSSVDNLYSFENNTIPFDEDNDDFLSSNGWWSISKFYYRSPSLLSTVDINSEGYDLSNNEAPMTFYYWLFFEYVVKNELYPAGSFGYYRVAPADVNINSISDIENVVIPNLGYSNTTEAFKAYQKYFVNFVLRYFTSQFTDLASVLASGDTGKALRLSLAKSSLPKRAYWRIVLDWFVNSNFVDVEDLLSKYVYQDLTIQSKSWKCANRYWENDYFTSAFASTQSGTDVPIPVNGSIKDLRNANSLQKVMELVLYSGKRYIDQILTLFGARSSDTRLDRCEVLGKSDFVFGIDEVTQTSESNAENPLGSFGGRALTAGADQMFHYHAEEHGMIMIVACIKPLASYIGVQDRLLFKTSPYDFLIPQFANVGEQEIYADELQQTIPASSSDVGTVFGYQRRYAEYMFKHNEVHADFAENMDYWTMARKFDVRPVLNTDFLQITDSDNLNRAFAVPSAYNHYYCYFSFEFKDVNALPRYLNYDL